MKNLLYWILVIGFFAALIFLSLSNETAPAEGPVPASTEVRREIKIGGAVLDAELALSIEAQTQGLSGRSGLEEGTGMLFVFENPGKYAFWMKDMNFPIDIIWIGADKRIVYIQKNALPESYPNSFQPEREAKYVLETVSGFSEKNNLKEGDTAEFDF